MWLRKKIDKFQILFEHISFAVRKKRLFIFWFPFSLLAYQNCSLDSYYLTVSRDTTASKFRMVDEKENSQDSWQDLSVGAGVNHLSGRAWYEKYLILGYIFLALITR
jgi:hypothetical protein